MHRLQISHSVMEAAVRFRRICVSKEMEMWESALAIQPSSFMYKTGPPDSQVLISPALSWKEIVTDTFHYLLPMQTKMDFYLVWQPMHRMVVLYITIQPI